MGDDSIIKIRDDVIMKKKILISVGIPAFNEEANIANLLHDILTQKEEGYKILEIIVASDNSTDRTDEIVRAFKNKKVHLIANSQRTGQAERQNQIIKASSGDILVLLNADIRIKDKNCIGKLVAPILSSEADLTSCDPRPMKAQDKIEKVLYTSIETKKRMFESYKEGNNVYTCHGRVRALSKRFYKKLHFNRSVGEDAFSYFFAISNGFRYKFVGNTYILYRLPSTIGDHKKQSIRFFQTKKLLSSEFGREFIEREYHLPRILGFWSVLRVALKKPLDVASYIVVFGFMRALSLFHDMSSNTWSVSESSKKLGGKK